MKYMMGNDELALAILETNKMAAGMMKGSRKDVAAYHFEKLLAVQLKRAEQVFLDSSIGDKEQINGP